MERSALAFYRYGIKACKVGDAVLLQIEQYRSGCSLCKSHLLYAEALERHCPELLFQLVCTGLFHKRPFVHRGNVPALSKLLAETILVPLLKQHFLRRHIAEQDIHKVQLSLSHLKSSGGNIQEGRSAFIPLKGKGGQIVIGCAVKDIIVVCHSRSYELRYAPLNQSLGHLRVFQLVAYRNLVAGADKFRKIVLQTMVRESAKLHGRRHAVTALCKHDSQHFAHGNGIISIRLIEIPDPHQQNSLGILCLELHILLHHRRIEIPFSHAANLANI